MQFVETASESVYGEIISPICKGINVIRPFNRLFYVVPFVFCIWMNSARAQLYAQGGAYFGQQMSGCSAGVAVPRAIAKIENKQKAIEKQLDRLQDQVRRLERDAEKAQREFEKHDQAIRGWLRTDPGMNIAQAVINQLREGGQPPSDEEACEKNGSPKPGAKIPWSNYCARTSTQTPTQDNPTPTVSTAASEWVNTVNSGLTAVTGGHTVCYGKHYVAEKNHSRLAAIDSGTGATKRIVTNEAVKCQNAIANYSAAFAANEKARADLEAISAEIANLENEQESLDDDKEYEVERWQDDMAEGKLSAGYCYTCSHPQAQPVGLADKLIGLTGVVAGAAAMYFGTKYAVDKNSQMGWGTSPWMPYMQGSNMLQVGMGYPFGGGGNYGGAFGGGNGAFGCTPGIGGGGPGGPGSGAFGYPSPYFNPNAGMMMPGMYPGNGMPGMMNPYGMPGMMGGPMMYPGGMNPYGMPGMGMGGPMMYPGGMNPYGMPGMMNPYGMGPGGMGGPFGNPMMNPQMSMLAMQQQQQMQQMYMQQLQGWMQQQQQMQQDQMQRMQIAGRLQMEMYRIQAQIQQLTGGGFGGGMGGFGGGMMGGGFGGGMGGGGGGYFGLGVGIGGGGMGGYFGIGGSLGLGGAGYLGGMGGMGGMGGFGAGPGGVLVPTGGYYNPSGDPNQPYSGRARGLGY